MTELTDPILDQISSRISATADTTRTLVKRADQALYLLMPNAGWEIGVGDGFKLRFLISFFLVAALSRISVKDTGIGINPDNLKRIFEPFEQVESLMSRQFQGTGLGLSLTKSLVELHSGKIWAESQGEGQGSTFRFEIPYGN